jgi:hypothetical protein
MRQTNIVHFGNGSTVEVEYTYRAQRSDQKRRRPPLGKIELRVRELRRLLLTFRYGDELPDNDDGRKAAFVFVCHLAHTVTAVRHRHGALGPRGYCDTWLREHCSWMQAWERRDLLESKMLKFSADTLGSEEWLAVSDKLRAALDLRSIGSFDMTKEQRAQRRKDKNRERKEAERRKAGAKPQSLSAERMKPWIALGMSRAIYYKRKKLGKLGETDSGTIFLGLPMVAETVSHPSIANTGASHRTSKRPGERCSRLSGDTSARRQRMSERQRRTGGRARASSKSERNVTADASIIVVATVSDRLVAA